MKSLKHYLVVIAISLLPILSIILSPLMLHSHDGTMHLARMPAYLDALTQGQIFPRWASNLNYAYGMPLFNFYYHLPYLLTSLFLTVGFGLVASFKIVFVLSFVLSGVGMFAFSRAFFGDLKKAYVATLLYQFAPFHLVDLVVRGDFGEGLAFAFLPFVLLFLVRQFENKQPHPYGLLVSLGTILMILSHSVVGLVSFLICVFFALWFAPSQRLRMQALLSLALGFFATSFFWLPVLVERKYTYGDLFMKDMYKSHFVPLWMLLAPNVTNASALQIGGIAVTLGIAHVIALATGIYKLVKQKLSSVSRSHIWFALIITACTIFIMHPVSAPIWNLIPVLRAFQFPWRFLCAVVFSLAFLGGAVFGEKHTPKWLFPTAVLVILLSTLVYWKPPLGFDHIDENYYRAYPLTTTFFGETDVIWSAGPAGAYAKAPFELIQGEGIISNPQKRDTVHTFDISAQTPVRIVDNTQYFPGWRVWVDGVKTPIEFQDQNWRGLITFDVPQGVHTVRIAFGHTPVRQIATIISLASVAFVVCQWIWFILKKHVLW